MITNHDQNQSSVFELEDLEEGFTLRDVVNVARVYGAHIVAIVGILAVLYVIGALSAYLFSPSRKVTTLAFRLEFRGAENGQYPNGTKFSPTEILGTPVLLNVYKSNRLDQFCRFEAFKSSVFVLESSEALDRLNRAYGAKLADVRLSGPERDALEKEFEEKKASLGHASYAITLLSGGDLQLPSSLRPKILNDILSTWAEQTVRDKGVALYDLSILSSGIFEPQTLESYDYIIALDMMRSKINRVIGNIAQLSEIPGAKVLRSQKSNASLAELRVRMEDSVQFHVQPLVGLIMRGGLSKDPGGSIEFLQSQLTFNELEKREAQARVETIRNALETYVSERYQPQDGEQPPASTSQQPVIPQISDSFLDRLVGLTSEGDDMRYRQALVDRYTDESMRVVPLEAEAQYYRTLIDSMQGFQSKSRTATPAEMANIRKQLEAAMNDAIRTTNEVNEIYAALSRDLNPSTVLYTASAAPLTKVERPFSPFRLLLMGVLFVLISVPVVFFAFVIADRVRRNTPREGVDVSETAPKVAPTADATTA